MTKPNITVQGNVEGSIVVGDNNFVVNTNHGTIVYKHAAPRVKLRDVAPQPPRVPRQFVNRVAELDQIEKWIQAREAITLSGEDGVGKSALIKKVATGDAARALPNGVVLVEGVDEDGNALSFDDVLQQMFDVLYESEPHLKVNAATARTYLSNTKPLVVFDNLNFSAKQISSLPDLFLQGAVLVAQAQTLDSETQQLTIKDLPRAESIQLFALKTDLTLSAGSKTILDSICDLLGDCPLAIVTTASILKANNLSLDKVLAALKDVKVQSHDKIKAGIERSYSLAQSLLNDKEKKALAIASVANGISVDPKMLNLSDASIEKLKAMELFHANDLRLFVAPAMRALVKPAVDEKSIQTQIILYLRDMLSTHPKDWALHRDELGNVLGAIKWASDLNRWDDVIALGRAIDPYLTLHGVWDVWKATLASMLDAAKRGGDRAAEGWALHQLGTREMGAGKIESARSLLNQALHIRIELKDSTGIVYTQHNLNLIVPPLLPPKRNLGRGVAAIVAGVVVSGLIVMAALITGAIFVFAPRPTPEVTDTLTQQVIVVSETPKPTIVLTRIPSLTPILTLTLTPTPQRLTATPLRTIPTSTATATLITDKTAPNLEFRKIEPVDKVISYGKCGPSEIRVTVFARDPSGVALEINYRYLTTTYAPASSIFSVQATSIGSDLYDIVIPLGTNPVKAFNGQNGYIGLSVTASDSLNNRVTIIKEISLAYCSG